MRILFLDILRNLYKNFDNKEKINFFYLIFSSVVVSILELFILYLIYNSLKIVSYHEDYINIYNINVPIIIFILITLFFIIFSIWFRYFHLKIISNFSFNFSKKISCEVFRNILLKPFVFYKNSKSSELIDLIVIKNNVIGQSVIIPAIKIVAGFVMLLIISLVSFYLIGFNFLFGLLGLLLLFSLFNFKSRNIKKNNSKILSSINNLIINIVNQVVFGIRDVKLNKLEKFHLNNFSSFLDTKYRLQTLNELLSHGPKIIIEGIIFIFMLITVLYIIYFSQDKLESFFLIGLLSISLIRIIPIVQQIHVSNIALSLNAVIFFEILKFIGDVNNSSARVESDVVINKSIKFNNVSFKHSDGNDVIKNLSIEFFLGNLVAISGKSGSGKSTFLDLFIGFLQPNTGSITYDDKLIESNSLYSNISYVPQKIYIFNGNFVDNIALGADVINFELFAEALKVAQLNDYVESLPLKEFTDLGEDGNFLSGGLRQRVGIARAIYMNRSIILMDEPTSALDQETEYMLIDALLEHCSKSNKLCIVVTHKIGLLKKFDFSYVFNNKTLNLI